MTEAWREAHPEAGQRDYGASFRPATPPRVPKEGMDEVFLESMNALGYAEALEDG